MDSRVSFHSQLSSIMETMAKSAFSHISKLVDEDSAELRLELSRLLFANSALTEKVNSLECELTIVKSDVPVLCKTYSSVGVQTVCYKDGDPHVSGSPVIEGIFGKDWCMNLWKDRDPYRLETVTNSPQCCDKLVPDHITVTEIKEEDYEEAAGIRQQETFSTVDDHEESSVVELERLSVSYSADGSTYSLSFDQEEDLVESAVDTEEPSEELSINDTEETFSAHIIPINEDDDDDDDVQFVQESHQEPAMDTAWLPGNNKQQTLLADTIENSTALEKDSHDNFNMLNEETVGDLNKDIFTCKICSRTFYHKGTLTHHMKFHKSNFCSICKQHFPHRSKLNMHTCIPPVLSHTKSCELCGKSFANPSALRIHYVVHTGEKPYSCSLCGKGFTQKGNLKCHLRIHTGERPFICGKCGKTFTQKVNLNHHLMAHRNREVESGKPFK
ncbi:zinc finger protein 239-like isoform X1 [Solea senegalensis]|uniref:Zinc finger protein 239-like isoform X1 n=2 Tax=Solea senegalensis TaxID=28829 RepID=A0AAV6RLX8_SOLSE|nr:gastrula zinc finger protein xFG20-1 [Solea senegalensis]KAG7505884.1 zinc finger protein 239-like isoform X1 [Solea senegalensis]